MTHLVILVLVLIAGACCLVGIALDFLSWTKKEGRDKTSLNRLSAVCNLMGIVIVLGVVFSS